MHAGGISIIFRAPFPPQNQDLMVVVKGMRGV